MEVIMDWLDNYINDKNLTSEELKYMHLDHLKMFAFRIGGCDNYESVKGKLILLQLSCGKGTFTKEVAYILKQTELTWLQRFWLKFQYIFL